MLRTPWGEWGAVASPPSHPLPLLAPSPPLLGTRRGVATPRVLGHQLPPPLPPQEASGQTTSCQRCRPKESMGARWSMGTKCA